MSARIEAGRVAIKTAQLNRPTQTIYDRYDPDPLIMALARKTNALLSKIIEIKKRVDIGTHIEAVIDNFISLKEINQMCKKGDFLSILRYFWLPK